MDDVNTMHPAMDLMNIRVLLIEDNPGDVRLIQDILHENNADHGPLIVADHLAQGLDRLTARDIDVVLLDLALPDSMGLQTLYRILHQAPQMPVIILTGSSDDAMALEAIVQGAQDYLVKGRFDRRLLVNSIYYSIARKRLLVEKDRLIAQQQIGINEASHLNGFLPICTHCKKIRDARGLWHELETYFKTYTPMIFTHCICPACFSSVYADVLPELKSRP